MSIAMRWVGHDESERVAQTRLHCYGTALREAARFNERMAEDTRANAGDFLLAERNGDPIGTATSLSLRMWMRGVPISCQGVAWVGTIKTERRRSTSASSEKGVASAIMAEVIRKAREREEIVSALMPFRASYYEHFGYGLIERRCDWTIPLSVLPTGPTGNMRFYKETDLPQLQACRQRTVEAGQCDIERPAGVWSHYIQKWQDGFVIVDPAPAHHHIQGWMYVYNIREGTRDGLRIEDFYFDNVQVLQRQLHFLASLKDQYSYASLTLPADFPLNRLLRETQIPHRFVSHPTSECRPYTRMQLRILNHQRLLESLKYPPEIAGSLTIAIHETEGHTSRLKLEIKNGQASAKATDATSDIDCSDITWASIVCGDLPVDAAANLGQLQTTNSKRLDLLESFSHGPVPFCRDFF